MTKEQKHFITKVANHWFLRNLFPIDTAIFIGCQFALESNFGTSSIAKNNNNLCGMKIPTRRVFYGYEDKNSDFAKYPTKDDCVIDYCSWVLFNRPMNINLASMAHYAKWLNSKHYCTEQDYINKIVSLYNIYNYEEQ